MVNLKIFSIIFVITSTSAYTIITNDDQINENNDDLKILRDNFETFRQKYLQNQSDILENIETSKNQVKSGHQHEFVEFLNQISQMETDFRNQDKDLSNEKQEILMDISKINNLTVEELRILQEKERVLENDYKDNKTRLNEKKVQLYESIDSDDVIAEMIMEQQINKVNKQLESLDKDFILKSQRIITKMSDLKASTAAVLNENYQKLISVYENEEKEAEILRKLSDLKKNAIVEWQEYSENIERVQSRVTEELNELAITSFKANKNFELNYSINYSKTRILVPKCCTITPAQSCAEFILDNDDDLIATDCVALHKLKIDIIFNGQKYTCIKENENDPKYSIFTSCSIVGDFRDSSCTIFMFDWSENRILGSRCSNGTELRSIRYNEIDYSCSLLGMLDNNEYFYQNCQKVPEESNQYIVNKSKTRFLIPKTENEDDEKICEEYTVTSNDDIYATDCREVFGGVPKRIEYDDQIYKCLNFEFDGNDDYLIYENCELNDQTVTSTENIRSLETIYIPSLHIYKGFTTKLSTSKCMKYVLNSDRYSSFDCQNENESIYLYDGRKLICQNLQIEIFSHKFSDCEENDSLFAPTTKDLSLTNYKVTHKTMFLVPKTDDINKISPCGPFSYKIGDFLFQSDCAQTDATIGSFVILNSNIYHCKYRSPTVNFDYFRFENCNSTEEDDQTVENYRWEGFHDRMTRVPENIVYGGYDRDGLDLFIIRHVNIDGISYGKGVDGETRKNGYVTNDQRENGAHNYEILTADRYVWCKYDPERLNNDNLPICRANHEYYLIPGTLLSNGTCRIGYGWKIYIKESNFQTLLVGQSKCE